MMAPRQRLSRVIVDEHVSLSSSSQESIEQQHGEQVPLVVSSNGNNRSSSSNDSTTTDSKKIPNDSTTSESSSTRSAAALAAAAEADLAREQHDYFNLIALLFVVGATLINWDLTKLLRGPEAAYIGSYFWVNWVTTLIYFIIDLLWVYYMPTCVKSPDIIIKHHIAAILYLACPVVFPGYEWMMGAVLTVEINTWFLILRRIAFKRQDIIPPVLQSFIGFMFYSTWIIVRLIIYPAIMFKFTYMAVDDYIRNGLAWHWEYCVPPIHFALVLLNLKWSYDLFKPFFVKQEIDNNKKGPVSQGL